MGGMQNMRGRSRTVMVLLLVLMTSVDWKWGVLRIEKRLGIQACKPVIFGQKPSPACCERARVSTPECICPAISPKVAFLIGGAKRYVRLVEGCGRRVPPGYKCGSCWQPPGSYPFCDPKSTRNGYEFNFRTKLQMPEQPPHCYASSIAM
ncbi:hypothetical protein RJ640_006441 [Escallonia rubra]|uniref:Bifunctional inhibitor/plant lipid transfer protein/seed storage helical domain-containing protein n=1 Tax=Escallonia rubra TaxID=112253 RepID=A0AA88UFK6_9ASTE|nr:hypothetical protein RJ640_006441 [Escallonia rubra]